MSRTACIVPWSQMVVRPNGQVMACCHANGTVGSIYDHPLEEIWNGDKLRDLRAALGRGIEDPTCKECWEQEAAGARSPRQIANDFPRVSGDTLSLTRLVAEGATLGYHAPAPPDTYVLQLGNLCNLKCRSCDGVASSRIAADPVARQWGFARIRPSWRDHVLQLAPARVPGVTYTGFDFNDDALVARGEATIEVATEASQLRTLAVRVGGACGLRVITDGEVREVTLAAGESEVPLAGATDKLRLVFTDVELRSLELRRQPERRSLSIVPTGETAWFKDVSALATAIAKHPRGAIIFLLGGEPFMIDEVWDMARELAASGLAKRLVLAMSTNCTQRRDDLAQLAPAFRHVVLHLSIDGYGPMYEYLRHGARWDEMQETLRWFRTLPNTSLLAFPTVQNYNALDIVRLFRFMDAQQLPFHHNLLARPERLSILNLPPLARRAAASQLRSYHEHDCRPQQRDVVKAYIDMLDSAGDAFDPVLFREFMLFTNDLDATRDQRFAEVAPDLYELIRASGVEWIADRHHAR